MRHTLHKVQFGTVQGLSYRNNATFLQMHQHVKTTGDSWEVREGLIVLDNDSLLAGYAIEQENALVDRPTPEGLVTYRFAFGTDAKWFFRMPENTFWAVMRTSTYGSREERFRIFDQARRGVLDTRV